MPYLLGADIWPFIEPLLGGCPKTALPALLLSALSLGLPQDRANFTQALHQLPSEAPSRLWEAEHASAMV